MKPFLRMSAGLVAGGAILASGALGLANSPVWTLEQQAAAAQAAGNIAQAATDWQQLVGLLAGATDLGSLTNEAVYSKDLGHYFLATGQYTKAVQAFDAEASFWRRAGHASWGDVDEILANDYRPSASVYVERGTALRKQANDTGAKFEPAWGTYLGFFVQADPAIGNNVAAIPQTYGRSPAILLYYLNWGESLPQADIQAARQADAALELALQPVGGLGQVLTDAAYLHSLAQQLAASGVPVFLRFGGEMNGNWLPWGMQPDGSSTFAAHARQFVRAFQLVATVMHATAPNVAMVWSPNFAPTTGTAAYYPGDAYVDWVGVSAYLDASNPGQPLGNEQGSLLANLQWIYSHYAQDKPIMIAEGAVGHQDLISGADVTQWAVQKIRSFFAGLPRAYPRVKAVVWWNSQAPGHSDYRLSNDAAVRQAFIAGTADPWYLTHFPATATQAYVPLAEAGLRGLEHLSAVIHYWQAEPSKVTFSLDGQTLDTATSAPYGVTVDFAGLASGTHTLLLTVYDQSGAVAFSRSFPFQTGGPEVEINGQPLDTPQPPVNKDGTILAPMRSVFEAMGARVSWDQATHTVTATAGVTSVRLGIGNDVATVDGAPVSLLQAPILMNGYTMVPLRFVAQTFGDKVTWDQAAQAVQIRT